MAAQQQEFMDSLDRAQSASTVISNRSISTLTPNAGHAGIEKKVEGAPLGLGSSIFLILFFSMFLYGGYSALYDVSARLIRNIHLVRSGTSWTGKVVDYKMSSGKNGRIWPVVDFTTPDGTPIQFESLSRPKISGYSAGQSVPILFDPKDPHIAEINQPDRLWGGMTVLFILGSFFSTLGGGVILLVLYVNFRKKGLKCQV